MKKIMLVNGWSDDNKGDAAIVQGLIKLLSGDAKSEQLLAETHVSILSNFGVTDARFASHYRHTAPSDGPVKIFGSLLPAVIDDRNAMTRRFRRVWLLFRSFFLLWLAPLFATRHFRLLLNEQEQKGYEAIAEADLVVTKGGHIYFSTGTLLSFVGLYINVFPILLAQRMKKPTVVYAQSIGPVVGGLHRRFLSYVLRRCSMVLAREPLSRDFTNQLTGTNDCELAWDTAFAVPDDPLPKIVVEALPHRFVAFTIRQWKFPYESGHQEDKYQRYLRTMAEMMKRISRIYGISVVLAPQVIGPTPLENDYTAWTDLETYLEGTDYHAIREDLSPGQLKALYGMADLVVGTRFHSVILALAAGVPSIAIAYHGYKTRGIMKMLGLEEYVFEIDDLEVEVFWNKLEAAFKCRAEYQEQLRASIANVAREATELAQRVLEFQAG